MHNKTETPEGTPTQFRLFSEDIREHVKTAPKQQEGGRLGQPNYHNTQFLKAQ